jgi:hypothetical protein
MYAGPWKHQRPSIRRRCGALIEYVMVNSRGRRTHYTVQAPLVGPAGDSSHPAAWAGRARGSGIRRERDQPAFRHPQPRAELVDAPVVALAAVREGDAKLLADAFNINTVGDLSRNKFFRPRPVIGFSSGRLPQINMVCARSKATSTASNDQTADVRPRQPRPTPQMRPTRLTESVPITKLGQIQFSAAVDKFVISDKPGVVTVDRRRSSVRFR